MQTDHGFLQIEVKAALLVHNVKMVEQGWPLNLVHDGKFLEDHRTLSFLNVGYGAVLNMVLNHRDKFLIFVIMLLINTDLFHPLPAYYFYDSIPQTESLT